MTPHQNPPPRHSALDRRGTPGDLPQAPGRRGVIHVRLSSLDGNLPGGRNNPPGLSCVVDDTRGDESDSPMPLRPSFNGSARRTRRCGSSTA